jgi:hypothetical protein
VEEEEEVVMVVEEEEEEVAARLDTLHTVRRLTAYMQQD